MLAITLSLVQLSFKAGLCEKTDRHLKSYKTSTVEPRTASLLSRLTAAI